MTTPAAFRRHSYRSHAAAGVMGTKRCMLGLPRLAGAAGGGTP
jgi:hypothetical protein